MTSRWPGANSTTSRTQSRCRNGSEEDRNRYHFSTFFIEDSSQRTKKKNHVRYVQVLIINYYRTVDMRSDTLRGSSSKYLVNLLENIFHLNYYPPFSLLSIFDIHLISSSVRSILAFVYL